MCFNIYIYIYIISWIHWIILILTIIKQNTVSLKSAKIWFAIINWSFIILWYLAVGITQDLSKPDKCLQRPPLTINLHFKWSFKECAFKHNKEEGKHCFSFHDLHAQTHYCFYFIHNLNNSIIMFENVDMIYLYLIIMIELIQAL